MAASYQAVAQANERWPRKTEASEAEPAVFWRRQHGASRTDWCDESLRRGGYRRHGDKDVL